MTQEPKIIGGQSDIGVFTTPWQRAANRWSKAITIDRLARARAVGARRFPSSSWRIPSRHQVLDAHKTNYLEWVLLMCINLQATGLWEAIGPDNDEYNNDRLALAAIVSSVPPDMVTLIDTKETACKAWLAVRTMRVGEERARVANV